MGDFDFINGMSMFIIAFRGSNTTDTVCISNVDHYKFYQYALIPAIVLTLLMAATKQRRQKLLSVLNGRPGLIFPMDTMTRFSRVSYCCAFGAMGFLVYQILLNGQFAVRYTGTIALTTFIAVLSMFIYGMVFFPVFTSLALETAVSYCVGSLYVWMFFIVQVYQLTECNISDEIRALSLIRALPSLLCLAYLSISMPIKCGLAIYHKKYFTPSLGEDPYSETIEEIKQSYQGKHVRHLLRKPDVVKQPEGIVNIMKASIMDMVGAWIYHNQDGFRYPTRLLSVMFVSACVVYVITVELLGSLVTILNSILGVLEQSLEDLGPEQPGEDESIAALRTNSLAVYYITYILKVSVIVSVTVSSTVTLLNILHMISSFRTNLFALYRGDYSHIPPSSKSGAISLCTGSIKYAGFQVAYIVWAYIISSTVIFIICLILATLIVLLMIGVTDWLVNKVLQLWPGLAFGIGLFVIQFLLAKFVFLQDSGDQLQLDNRHFYFIFVYFMFFYNIFLGLFSCLLRIIKAIGVGTVFLARLDNSSLPRKFEFFDPGFSAYQGYIHMEAAHTHPVVNVFIRLLVALSNSRKMHTSRNNVIDMSIHVISSHENSLSNAEHPTSKPINVVARFNWFVTYTLLQNPMVRIYRKGFIQSMKKARKEGLKVPISDLPITDFDLVKAQVDRDQMGVDDIIVINSENNNTHGDVTANGHTVDITKEAEVKNTQIVKTNKALKYFRKFKKRTGHISLVSLNSVSEENILGHDNDSYVKI